MESYYSPRNQKWEFKRWNEGFKIKDDFWGCTWVYIDDIKMLEEKIISNEQVSRKWTLSYKFKTNKAKMEKNRGNHDNMMILLFKQVYLVV